MRRIASVLAIAACAGLAASACSLQFDANGDVRYYPSEGWNLPGAFDFNPKGPVSDRTGFPQIVDIPGAKAQYLPHDEYP